MDVSVLASILSSRGLGLAAMIGGALCLLSAPTHAQEQEGPTGGLSGRVVDAESGDPLQNATVALWKTASADSTLITGTVTGPEGRFSFEAVPIGSYLLRVSYVGYIDRQFPETRPARSENNGDLGTIRLNRKTTQAEGVEVTADRPAARLETDRTIYNTSKRALSAGGSARTVLEDLPSVRIDTDGSISYRGNESVALHINGNPASLQGQSLVSYLQSLPADAVQRVEIIPNPSAKYEPEGMAGIINIVLERDLASKWGGGVTAGGRIDANSRLGGNGSVNVGYQEQAWRFVTTYSHRRGSEEDSDSRFVRRFNEDGPTTVVHQTGTEEEVERSHALTARLNYEPSASTSLGFESTVSLRREEENNRTLEQWSLGNRGASSDSANVRHVDERAEDETIDARLSFDHVFVEDQHTLTAELRYDRDFETETGTYVDSAPGPQGDPGVRRAREREVTNEDEQDGSLEIDYMRPLGALELEAGYKGTLRRLDSDQTSEGLSFATERRAFTFDEVIHAAYGILSDEWGPFGVEAGLRAEAVHTIFDLSTESETTKSSYVSLYPSAFLTYDPTQQQQVRLSYSKRVDRPSLWDINPIEDNENPTFQERGNPDLNPEYIHSFELSVVRRWNWSSLTVTPYLRHTVNEIEEVEFEETIDGRTVTVRQARNLASSTSYGTEVVATFNWNDRLEGTLSGNLYRSVTDASNLSSDLSNDALTYSGRANIRGTIWEGLQLELSQYYRPATDIPGGRMDRRTSTEVALQQDLFGGDGSLTFRVDDLFNATRFNVWRRTDNFYQESTFQWGSREFTLTFQYSFGADTEEREGPENDFGE